MRKKINPNRMELFRLRKRLVLAQRGHKLLKDKLEGLIREVTEQIERYDRLRREVDTEFPKALARFTLAAAVASEGAVAGAVRQNASVGDIHVDTRRVMGVPVPMMKAPKMPESFRYSLTQTPPELDAAFEELMKLPRVLFQLAESERTLQLLAKELESTRRRTNALEHVMIPELQEQRRDVEQKISEQERSNISRLMKVKSMLMVNRKS